MKFGENLGFLVCVIYVLDINIHIYRVQFDRILYIREIKVAYMQRGKVFINHEIGIIVCYFGPRKYVRHTNTDMYVLLYLFYMYNMG